MSRLPGHLYFWVLLAILAGGVLGYIDPATAVRLKLPVTASSPSSSC